MRSIYPPHWREFVNYSGQYAGKTVQAAYSHEAKRYVLPGETVYLKDEFGYWRETGPVIFAGRCDPFYRYQTADGHYHLMDWHVYTGIEPVGA